MVTKKIIIPLVALLSITIIVITYIQTTTNNQNIPTPQPTRTPTPTIPLQSTLQFSPKTINLTRGKTAEAEILLNTQGLPPTLAQLELAYDPLVLSKISLTPGTLFQNPAIILNNIDPNIGRISYALNLLPNQEPTTVSGTIAKLQFTLNPYTTQNTSTIRFLPKTSILSDISNIPLQETGELQITIDNPFPIASSSAQP